MAPQIIYLVLSGIGLGVTLAKSGEPSGKYNFWTTLVSTIISLGLLLWGGFFDPLFR